MKKNILILFVISLLLLSSCFKKQKHTITGAGEPIFTLSGRVIDIDNGRAIANAMVSIDELGIFDKVDENGNYQFDDLRVGSRFFRVSAPNYDTSIVLINFTYDNLDVKYDIHITKRAIIQVSADLPFDNPSGIWYENSHFYITSYDDVGGTIYELDEQFRIAKISNYLITWLADSCIVGYEYIYVLFPPDTVLIEPVAVPCHQALMGIVRIGDYFYTTNGCYYVNNEPVIDQQHYLYRIEPQTLIVKDTLEIAGFGANTITKLHDITYDGRSVWMCDHYRDRSNFVKLWKENLEPQSILPSPIAQPSGIAYDGRYLWISEFDMIYQLNSNLTIRNRYKVPKHFIRQIAWGGNTIWALQHAVRRVVELDFPFTDHH